MVELATGRVSRTGTERQARDLTEDGTGRLGLAFNNPYLQRVYVDMSTSPAPRRPSYV